MATSITASPTADWAKIKLQHLSWRTKFRSLFYGARTVAEVPAKDHTACDMGKWLYSFGVALYGEDHDFKVLLEKHKLFHQYAGHALKMYSNGQQVESLAVLDQHIFPISTELLGMIDTLQKRELSRAS
jgi:Chemoreceptor zinc-binding domain